MLPFSGICLVYYSCPEDKIQGVLFANGLQMYQTAGILMLAGVDQSCLF